MTHKKEVKALVKSMTFGEALHYCHDHPRFKIPNASEAMEIEKVEHKTFWISDELADRNVIYDKQNQVFIMQHENFKNNVVVIAKDDTWD